MQRNGSREIRRTNQMGVDVDNNEFTLRPGHTSAPEFVWLILVRAKLVQLLARQHSLHTLARID